MLCAALICEHNKDGYCLDSSYVSIDENGECNSYFPVEGKKLVIQLQDFLESETDSYAILQLRRTDETTYERFMAYSYLQSHGREPNIDHYDVMYVAELHTTQHVSQDDMLEKLYTKFNMERPEDFYGHSLSVSDIVALKRNGVVSYHYVDSIGFKELNGFGPETT